MTDISRSPSPVEPFSPRLYRHSRRFRMALPVSLLTSVLVIYLMIHPPALLAREAQISDVLVTQQADSITVYARVTNCFTRDMQSAIMAGVPTTFTFLVDLYRERSYWPDKKVGAAVIRQTIKYDNVKKLFILTVDGNRNPTTFSDLESAKRAMAEMTARIDIPRKVDRRQGAFYVMIKAKLDKIRLPLYMEYIFFFVSLWDFETDWYRKEVSF
ncbi:MAG: DUF4390 domain-containing protein [Syntrophobacterales bacterium]|nr:DUF4390 domain-containing protein [Syntrophobacterales bacterium]